MARDFLSNIELYYSSPNNFQSGSVKIEGDEAKHILRVMRHVIGDTLHVTDGQGKIAIGDIDKIENGSVELKIKETKKYDNDFANITFCIPRLKNTDRFEFALEKCIELEITNFIVFESERTVAKGEKLERWNKIALAAMKQSLRAYLPKIEFSKSLKEIIKRPGEKILFEQNSNQKFTEYLKKINNDKKYLFIFGPEGGLTDDELNTGNAVEMKLTENRLRTETAVITTASLITTWK